MTSDHVVPDKSEADRELESRVAEVLRQQSIPAFRQLRIDARDGTVTLRGRVDSFYEKQVALHCCLRVPGVKRGLEGISVGDESPARSQDRSQTASMAELASLVRSRNSSGRSNDRRSYLGWGLSFVSITVVLALAACLSAAWSSSDGDVPEVYPVTARLSFNGEATPGAFAVFHPVGAALNALRPSGRADQDGKLTLTTYRMGDGIPAGEYIVTVEWRKLVISGEDFNPGPNVIPPRYAKPATSPLKVRVTDYETPPLDLKLTTCPLASEGATVRRPSLDPQ